MVPLHVRALRRLPFMHLPIEYAVAFLVTLGQDQSISAIVTPLGLPAFRLIRSRNCVGLALREQLPREFVEWLTKTMIAALERDLIPLAGRTVLWVYYFSAWLDSPDFFRFATARLLLGKEVNWSRVDDTASVLDDNSIFTENKEKLNLSYFLHNTLIDAITESADSLSQLILQLPLTCRNHLIPYSNTPLTATCEARRDASFLRLLLQAGYDVNAEDGHQNTPLLSARSIALVEIGEE
ncbi:hypothetical protein HDU96_000462 [Phlyctochytrium bullatum]|nr:hypothetical protein HDU96_000462 [Phlyctochytrium bullatum]